MKTSARAAGSVLAAASLAVGLVACADDEPSAATQEPTTTSTPEAVSVDDLADLAEFYEQQPVWAPCAEGSALECALVDVPRDYDDPTGDRIQLAVNRLPAANPAGKIGSLIVNPGGPGGSGVGFVEGAEQWAGPLLRTRYDIVGFDPRGVAASSPIDCMGDKDRDEYYADMNDAGAAEEYADACEEVSGDLLPYVGTENVAADLDVLRQVVGDQKLNYLGVSYGTLLGQYYAEMFPGRVGRMALDSVMDPKLSTSALVVDNAEAFDKAYDTFLGACVAAQSCPLGADVEAAREATEDLIAEADEEPLPVADQPERPATGNDIRTALQYSLLSVDTRAALTEALAAAEDGDGAGIRALADDARGYQDGQYDNSDLAHTAVVCLWTTDDQRTDDAVESVIVDATEKSAIFGPSDVFRPCSSWEAEATVAPHEITAPGTPEILLLNNTGDPSTPLKWAEATAAQLDNAVLVLNEGDGHGAFMKGPCTYSILEQYLIAGSTPDPGIACHDNTPKQ